MDFTPVLPELIVAGTGIAVLLVDLFLTGARKRFTGYLAMLGAAAALAAAIRSLVGLLLAAGGADPTSAIPTAELFGGMLTFDLFSLVFKVLFAVVALIVLSLSVDFVEKRGLPVGEYNALVLFAVLGMMLMSGSRDLVMIYLGLETASIASYALAGLLRHDPRSGEAALKYFLTGALASAVILFGMSLVFGSTGSTSVERMFGAGLHFLEGLDTPVIVWENVVAVIGLVVMIAGFGFKIAAVPFHFWAPDAYEGAPTPVTAFFSVGPKAAAFAAVLRIFGPVLLAGYRVSVPGVTTVPGTHGSAEVLPLLFAILAVVTMTVGNITALAQHNIKRMLAYSSIAHAGYMLVGIATGTPIGLGAVVFYLLAYAAMNLGAFAVVIWLNNRGFGDEIDDYAGLGRRAPFAAGAMVLCFLSLIGIPPLAGFFGKLYIFLAAVDARMVWLAVIMVVNSAISVGYYYGVVRRMYLEAPAAAAPGGAVAASAPEAPAPGTRVKSTPLVAAGLGVAVVAVLALGFAFDPLIRLTVSAAFGL